jgi:hypothetical protein
MITLLLIAFMFFGVLISLWYSTRIVIDLKKTKLKLACCSYKVSTIKEQLTVFKASLKEIDRKISIIEQSVHNDKI